MQLVEPGFTIVDIPDKEAALRKLERAARLCYQSAPEEELADVENFLRKKILQTGHHSVVEHCGASVQFVFDRGVSHEIVRHRIASFSQESTRYCNYSKEKYTDGVRYIRPFFLEPAPGDTEEVLERKARRKGRWLNTLKIIEDAYLEDLADGGSPQEARGLLPNILKTEILVTCNFREWREIFRQRTSIFAHPQMREVMIPLLKQFKELVPVVFEDVGTVEW